MARLNHNMPCETCCIKRLSEWEIANHTNWSPTILPSCHRIHNLAVVKLQTRQPSVWWLAWLFSRRVSMFQTFSVLSSAALTTRQLSAWRHLVNMTLSLNLNSNLIWYTLQNTVKILLCKTPFILVSSEITWIRAPWRGDLTLTWAWRWICILFKYSVVPLVGYFNIWNNCETLLGLDKMLKNFFPLRTILAPNGPRCTVWTTWNSFALTMIHAKHSLKLTMHFVKVNRSGPLWGTLLRFKLLGIPLPYGYSSFIQMGPCALTGKCFHVFN